MSCGLGKSASVEMILEKSGFISVAVIDGYHLPHSVSSIIPEFISRDYFSHSMRTEILPLACDNLHELAALSFLGDLRKTVSISE